MFALLLAYLGVAAQMHWWPLEQKLPVCKLVMREPSEATSSKLDRFLDCLGDEPAQKVRITLDVFPDNGVDQIQSTGSGKDFQELDTKNKIIYAGKDDTGRLRVVQIQATCSWKVDNCVLLLNFTDGPGSQFGYDRVKAGVVSAYGFYQVGEVVHQTQTTVVSLIPITPPVSSY